MGNSLQLEGQSSYDVKRFAKLARQSQKRFGPNAPSVEELCQLLVYIESFRTARVEWRPYSGSLASILKRYDYLEEVRRLVKELGVLKPEGVLQDLTFEVVRPFVECCRTNCSAHMCKAMIWRTGFCWRFSEESVGEPRTVHYKGAFCYRSFVSDPYRVHELNIPHNLVAHPGAYPLFEAINKTEQGAVSTLFG